jgi:hypothetical protein
MEQAILDQTVELMEKANAGLEPELLKHEDARRLMETYAKVEKLAAFGVAALARKVHDSAQVARVTGTSIGEAKTLVATSKEMQASDDLSFAMQRGDISLSQATEIASAEESAPGAARELVAVAQEESYQVFRERAQKTKLEAEQHKGLGERQRSARKASSHTDALGMVNIHLSLEPHVGAPIVARAEAEADRLARKARAEGKAESSEKHLADGYASLLSGAGKGHAKRPELVVLVSHEVAKRGWKDVGEGEVCKIPGIGPVAPQVAKEIAADAFLSGVFYDGKDLRHLKRWTRSIPIEVQMALELGDPPEFDGVKCVDCGHRFRNEIDHFHPKVARGPTSLGNLGPRCNGCHKEKTERDRKAGLLTPPAPDP